MQQESFSKICLERDKKQKKTPSADNLRVKRTRILLREALIALIEEQGFDSLTVGSLTERAMASWAAFYRNYQDALRHEKSYPRGFSAAFGESRATDSRSLD